MGVQADIELEAWKAAIPVRLTLAADDIVVAGQHPRPFLTLVQRSAYLPFVAEHLKSMFQHLLPPGEATPWLEFAGSPLQWHIPAGVLYDAHSDRSERPWPLTVHFRNCPQQQLLPWSADLWRSSYLNSMKEAAVICTGTANRIMNMASATLLELQQSAAAGNCRTIAGIGKQLGFDTAAMLLRKSGRLPVKVATAVVDDHGVKTLEIVTSPLEAFDGNGQTVTLQHALVSLLPQHFGNSSAREPTTSATAVIISGSRVDVSLPLIFLYMHLHAADQFLYISIKCSPREEGCART